MNDSRNVSVIHDLEGKKIVIIHDIRFRGKRKINWKEVEQYLKRYIGEVYEIMDSADIVYVGKDFADEYSGSQDTARLKGALAKAKANASQGIPELINLNPKHQRDAKFGWYRYDSRFGLPVYGEDGELERYNIFHVEMLIRHDADGKRYLYDVVNIKKETGTPLEQ